MIIEIPINKEHRKMIIPIGQIGKDLLSHNIRE